MELIVIGIDGGTKEIIEGMPMPFTQSLIANSYSKSLEEDLISRGWAEVLTGEHAATNKAFYLMPLADGTYNFSASYSQTDMTSCSTNKPIWQVLNDNNVSVGIANVPTTGPAEKLQGFIIAGGGGGIKASDKFPDAMVYPPEYNEILRKNNYIFDVRLPGGESTVPGFLKKISNIERIQKDTFIELSKNHKPRFGFHCFRTTTEVQYLARHEINKCIKRLAECKEKHIVYEPEFEFEKRLIDYYKNLDESIRSIFQELNPENYLLIGDHSTALFEHEGNIDVWLNEKGYLTKATGQEIFMQKVWRLFRRTRFIIRRNKKSRKPNLIRNPITKFSKTKSFAFGTFYDTGNFAGIFINDKARFGGPVKNVKDANELIEKICTDFNSDATAMRFGFSARPYRSSYASEPYEQLMPDIRIHKPDSVYFSSRHWEFIRENKNLKPLEESLQGIRYPHTGTKGRDPLFIYSEGLKHLLREDDPNDLRLAYHLISRFFNRTT